MVKDITQNKTTSDTSNNSTYSQHDGDYIYSYLSALSEIYQSTLVYNQINQELPAESDMAMDQNTLASFYEINNHLVAAESDLESYISDPDESISATAKLFYVDIETESQDVNQMSSLFSEGIQNEDITALQELSIPTAKFIADRTAVSDNLSQAIPIIKYIIQIPSQDSNPTGPIDYNISPNEREYLLQQIGTTFPDPLDENAIDSNNRISSFGFISDISVPIENTLSNICLRKYPMIPIKITMTARRNESINIVLVIILFI